MTITALRSPFISGAPVASPRSRPTPSRSAGISPARASKGDEIRRVITPHRPKAGGSCSTEGSATLDRRGLLIATLGAALALPGAHVLPASAAEVNKVFVAGATGQTGRRVVSQAMARGVAVRAGSRDPKKAASLGIGIGGAVEIVEADVTKSVDSLVAAIGDADTVVCATGFTPSAANWGGLKPKASFSVDKEGTIALVDAAKKAGVKHFVLVSSLLTNAPAVGQAKNPNYAVLNAFGGVLDAKREAEIYLQSSGIPYTIVRPGGLSNDPPSGNIVLRPQDTLFGLDSEIGREISRDQVAEVAVEALFDDDADNKIVEVVAAKAAPAIPKTKWFAGL